MSNSLWPSGVIQARILQWVAMPFSRGSSQPRTEPRSPALQIDSLPSELLTKNLFFSYLIYILLVCYRAIISLWILFFVCFKTIDVVLTTSQLLVQLSDPDHHLKAPHPFVRYKMFPMDWGCFQDSHLSSPQVSFNLSLYILLGLWGHFQQYGYFSLRSQIWSQLGSPVTENQRCGSLEPSQLHFFPILPSTRFTPASHLHWSRKEKHPEHVQRANDRKNHGTGWNLWIITL